ncbi:alpha/beta fold hydrolase [Streptomyces sp. LZ34]
MTGQAPGAGVPFSQWGTGAPPLLLLHGFMNSHLDWAEVAEELATDRRVVAYDLRGHGDSARPGGRGGYSLGQLVDDLDAFAAAHRLAPFDLVGHSLGGVVAMRFALARPGQLRSLVLMNAAAVPTGAIAPEVIERLTEIGRREGMSAVADLLDRIGAHTGSRRTDAQRARSRANIGRMDAEAFAAFGTELGAYASMLDDLAGLTLPVTVIFGEDDALGGAECAAIAERVPGARISVIPEADHAPHEENREAWLAAVRTHLARLPVRLSTGGDPR